jgi:hypothetical protein
MLIVAAAMMEAGKLSTAGFLGSWWSVTPWL